MCAHVHAVSVICWGKGGEERKTVVRKENGGEIFRSKYIISITFLFAKAMPIQLLSDIAILRLHLKRIFLLKMCIFFKRKEKANYLDVWYKGIKAAGPAGYALLLMNVPEKALSSPTFTVITHTFGDSNRNEAPRASWGRFTKATK